MPAGTHRLAPLCLAALLTTMSAGRAPGRDDGAPKVGDVRKVTVVSVAIKVGSTGKEVKRVTYTPPPGWYVRGHAVECAEKAGNSSFAVNTMPRHWEFVSEEQVKRSYKVMVDAATNAKDVPLKARLEAEQERTLTEIRKGRSSHHALVVDACAAGEGLFRSGGSLTLTVTAELVYVGTKESLERAVARGK